MDSTDLVRALTVQSSAKFIHSPYRSNTEMYVKDILSGICDGKAMPIVTKDKYSTALVNGQNTLGPVVGNFAMKLAISKAKEYGVGWVTAHSKSLLRRVVIEVEMASTCVLLQIVIIMESLGGTE